MWTKTLLLAAALAGAAASPARARQQPPVDPAPGAVDLAICLDTSGSMDGLIDAARQRLWSVVNELAGARPTPRLRVALLTFGNDGHPAEMGWVHVDSAFTEDLDRISSSLFALTTNGGTEYVGRVLQAAVQRLEWSPDPGTLRLIFVAGNESAEQDPAIDFRQMCSEAIQADILVNSIYCGGEATPEAAAWREVATRADGQFACIDQDGGTLVVESPFDQELADLSAALNTTYVPFGAAGAEGCGRQKEEDRNAVDMNWDAAAGRALAKAQALYSCASWDLVDAVTRDEVKLEEVEAKDLPEPLQALSPEELKKVVDEKQAERAAIQEKIQELSKQRAQFVEQELERQGQTEDAAFDTAIRRAVRSQAESRGFDFEAVNAAIPSPEGGDQGPQQDAGSGAAEVQAPPVDDC